MKTEDDADFVPTNDTLMGVLRKLEDGDFANAAGAEVQRLFAKLRAVAERKNANATGKITITLTVRMGAEGYTSVTPDIKTKAPEIKRRESMVFVDEDGDLVSRPVERQQALFAVGTHKDPTQPAVKAL